MWEFRLNRFINSFCWDNTSKSAAAPAHTPPCKFSEWNCICERGLLGLLPFVTNNKLKLRQVGCNMPTYKSVYFQGGGSTEGSVSIWQRRNRELYSHEQLATMNKQHKFMNHKINQQLFWAGQCRCATNSERSRNLWEPCLQIYHCTHLGWNMFSWFFKRPLTLCYLLVSHIIHFRNERGCIRCCIHGITVAFCH